MSQDSARILVALDPTGCAWEVADVAADLAARLGVEAVLMTAIRVPAGVESGAVLHGHDSEGLTPLQLLSQDAHGALDELAEVFRTRDVPTRNVVREGGPAAAVLAVAAELRPLMIVTGTHGRVGLQRLMLGSVAEDVLRHASCPVLTVRTQSAAAHPGLSQAQEEVLAEADG